MLTGRAVLLGPLQPVAAGCILLQPVTACYSLLQPLQPVTACYSLKQPADQRVDRTPADSLLTTTTDCYTSIPLSFAQTNILFLCTEFRCYNRYKVLHPLYQLSCVAAGKVKLREFISLEQSKPARQHHLVSRMCTRRGASRPNPTIGIGTLTRGRRVRLIRD